MKSWDSESWDIVTRGDRTVCYWDSGSASVEAGSCAIDFLDIDWKSIRRELEEDWCSPQEEMIVHNRLRDPNAAPYYRLARWAHNTVERLRELNPVYGENFRRWVRFEVERVYLAAYWASEDSLCVDELIQNKIDHPSPETGEELRRYSETIRPIGVKEMAAGYLVRFLDAYPEYPDGMVFTVDERVVRKYLKGKKAIKSGDVIWNMRKASKAGEEILLKLAMECDSPANCDDDLLLQVSRESRQRLLKWMDDLHEYQQMLEKLIERVLDADNVSSLKGAKNRIAELRQMPEYCAMKQMRSSGHQVSVTSWGRGVPPYEYSPILLITDSFDWMCQHRKRRLRRCGHCGRYFILDSPQARFCQRPLEQGEETCRDYEKRVRTESPDMNEIDRIYKSARDVYSRKLRNATNQGTERHKAEKNLYQTWREAAIDLRDEARRGVVTTEELRKRLCYENREKLVKEWKDKESRRAELEFRAKTE